MKATIEFQLPEDRDDFIIYQNALNWALSLLEVDNKLRQVLKHGHEYTTADEALQAIRDELYETMQEHNIHLDMIP